MTPDVHIGSSTHSEAEPTRMRILVTGGRKYRDSGRMYMVLEEYVDFDPIIVHGDYDGADRLAKEAANGKAA